MGLLDMFKRDALKQSAPTAIDQTPEVYAHNFEDPAFLEHIRMALGGAAIDVATAMKNPAVSRSVNLITNSIAMLPWIPKTKDANGVITDQRNHPLANVLLTKPNDWQTPFKFKRQMMNWVLVHGNAYALVVRSMGRVIKLIPIEPNRVSVIQNPDWSVEYQISTLDGRTNSYTPDDIIHLTSQSSDGLVGLSRVQLAADVITTHISLRLASRRIFENGMMVQGFLEMPDGKKLSPEAYARLKQSMVEKYSGADNAGKTAILEEGLKYNSAASTAQDSQMVELSDTLKQEIGMVFDVPRPFLFLDDTSWGSGIEQLKIMLHSGALSPWYSCIEDELNLKCFSPQERTQGMFVDIDERELMRGTLKDQAEYLSKALGSGGGYGWMEQNEARSHVGLSFHPKGRILPQPSGGQNEPETTPRD